MLLAFASGLTAQQTGLSGSGDGSQSSLNIGATSVGDPAGVKLESVDSSGRAARFGLQKGDVVRKINGQTVNGAASFLKLMSGVAQGAAVSIQVLRNGKETTVGREATSGGGGRGGMGGGFGMGGGETQLLKQFDKNGDGYLNAQERKAARESMGSSMSGGFGRGSFGGGSQQSGKAGMKLTPADAKSYTTEPFYDLGVLRTLFLEFEESDWEQELVDFHNTDVEVPAKLTVDGKVYPGVGVHFRGMTSYQSVGNGSKRSLGLSINMIDKKQHLYGYRTLNLLNAISDPTFMRTVLYLQVARNYYPAPKANFVRVVINGESWGVYVNQQQFNTDLTKDSFGSSAGNRWKVPMGMGGGGALAYLGDNAESYKRSYEIKSKDDPKAWADLIRLCKVLNQTPSEQLEKALDPILDIDGVLKYLAVDVSLINNDGYWTRGTDFSLYEDEKGRFHVIPYDMNETIRPGEGMGGGRGGGGFMGPGGGSSGGVRLDPLSGANDSNKPLLYRLMAVPSLRTRFLGYVRDIAEKWMTWEKVSPIVSRYQALIDADVKADTRKLGTYEAFVSGIASESAAGSESSGFWGRRGGMNSAPELSLKAFMAQRRAYLLEYTAPKTPSGL
jgi:hypothetical protein